MASRSKACRLGENGKGVAGLGSIHDDPGGETEKSFRGEGDQEEMRWAAWQIQRTEASFEEIRSSKAVVSGPKSVASEIHTAEIPLKEVVCSKAAAVVKPKVTRTRNPELYKINVELGRVARKLHRAETSLKKTRHCKTVVSRPKRVASEFHTAKALKEMRYPKVTPVIIPEVERGQNSEVDTIKFGLRYVARELRMAEDSLNEVINLKAAMTPEVKQRREFEVEKITDRLRGVAKQKGFFEDACALRWIESDCYW